MKTEIVFILDRSGSMAGLEGDTIGGYNALLDKQKKLEGEAYVTTVLFNEDSKLLHDRITIEGIAPLTEVDYEVGGMTALYDAVGMAIQKIKNVQQATKKELRADNVLFIITTDGHENASREYGVQQIQKMIKKQQKDGWEFLFLGANIDAVDAASNIGIAEENAVQYKADSMGTELNFNVLSESITEVRRKGRLERTWKKKIEEDFLGR